MKFIKKNLILLIVILVYPVFADAESVYMCLIKDGTKGCSLLENDYYQNRLIDENILICNNSNVFNYIDECTNYYQIQSQNLKVYPWINVLQKFYNNDPDFSKAFISLTQFKEDLAKDKSSLKNIANQYKKDCSNKRNHYYNSDSSCLNSLRLKLLFSPKITYKLQQEIVNTYIDFCESGYYVQERPFCSIVNKIINSNINLFIYNLKYKTINHINIDEVFEDIIDFDLSYELIAFLFILAASIVLFPWQLRAPYKVFMNGQDYYKGKTRISIINLLLILIFYFIVDIAIYVSFSVASIFYNQDLFFDFYPQIRQIILIGIFLVFPLILLYIVRRFIYLTFYNWRNGRKTILFLLIILIFSSVIVGYVNNIYVKNIDLFLFEKISFFIYPTFYIMILFTGLFFILAFNYFYYQYIIDYSANRIEKLLPIIFSITKVKFKNFYYILLFDFTIILIISNVLIIYPLYQVLIAVNNVYVSLFLIIFIVTTLFLSLKIMANFLSRTYPSYKFQSIGFFKEALNLNRIEKLLIKKLSELQKGQLSIIKGKVIDNNTSMESPFSHERVVYYELIFYDKENNEIFRWGPSVKFLIEDSENGYSEIAVYPDQYNNESKEIKIDQYNGVFSQNGFNIDKDMFEQLPPEVKIFKNSSRCIENKIKIGDELIIVGIPKEIDKMALKNLSIYRDEALIDVWQTRSVIIFNGYLNWITELIKLNPFLKEELDNSKQNRNENKIKIESQITKAETNVILSNSYQDEKNALMNSLINEKKGFISQLISYCQSSYFRLGSVFYMFFLIVSSSLISVLFSMILFLSKNDLLLSYILAAAFIVFPSLVFASLFLFRTIANIEQFNIIKNLLAWMDIKTLPQKRQLFFDLIAFTLMLIGFVLPYILI